MEDPGIINGSASAASTSGKQTALWEIQQTGGAGFLHHRMASRGDRGAGFYLLVMNDHCAQFGSARGISLSSRQAVTRMAQETPGVAADGEVRAERKMLGQ